MSSTAARAVELTQRAADELGLSTERTDFVGDAAARRSLAAPCARDRRGPTGRCRADELHAGGVIEMEIYLDLANHQPAACEGQGAPNINPGRRSHRDAYVGMDPGVRTDRRARAVVGVPSTQWVDQ